MDKNKLTKSSFGFSIVELLVVVTVFTILAVITTQSLVLILRGSRKSESLIAVRENVNYAMSIMERQIRTAREVTCPDSNTLNYIDSYGISTSFACDDTNGYIASGSARITSSEIVIDCSAASVFTCNAAVGSVPPSVDIDIRAQAADSSGAEGAEVTSETHILLRSY